MRVLLVETAGSVRLRLAEALREIEGLEVATCAPSRDGIVQRIAEQRIDVVVVDMQMPGGALDLVRSIKGGEHPPIVIALSTFSSVQYRAACHRAGAEFFFDKVHDQPRFYEAVAGLRDET